MASQFPPVKNAAYTIYAYFMDSDGAILSSPTIAAGDIKVQKDGGAAANLATTPTVANGLVPIVLSAAEMNADAVNVIAQDAAGDEWIDQAWAIKTAGATLDSLVTDVAELETGLGVLAVAYGNLNTQVATTGVALKNDALSASKITQDAVAKIAAGINYSVVAIAPDGALAGGKITIRAHDSFTVPLVVGSIADYSELYFTVKSATTVADAAATVHISESAGLEYIVGGVATTPANGSILVSSAATGAMTVTLDEVETAKLVAGNYVYGVKKITASGQANTLMEGACEVVTAVVREVT